MYMFIWVAHVGTGNMWCAFTQKLKVDSECLLQLLPPYFLETGSLTESTYLGLLASKLQGILLPLPLWWLDKRCVLLCAGNTIFLKY